MVDCARRVRAIARAGLSEEELDSLKSICERIRANLERPVEEPTTAAPCEAVATSSVGDN
jgi:hypothetical protein